MAPSTHRYLFSLNILEQKIFQIDLYFCVRSDLTEFIYYFYIKVDMIFLGMCFITSLDFFSLAVFKSVSSSLTPNGI